MRVKKKPSSCSLSRHTWNKSQREGCTKEPICNKQFTREEKNDLLTLILTSDLSHDEILILNQILNLERYCIYH